jgi:hypothetical protein
MAEKTYTGVTFDKAHTYRDWGLRLKSLTIGIPQAKTSYVDVPGMNGSLDLTEAQNGGIVYEMRTLKMTFDARNCNYSHWSGLVSRIAKEIEGKEKRIILDTDAGYYYTGRCHIDTKKTNEVLAEISIECTCEPYKLDIHSSDEPWIWDTFSFIDGVIRSTSDIMVNSPSDWKEIDLEGWPHNETLKIVSNASMKVKYRNNNYSIYAGENIMYDMQLYEGKNKLYFMGSGKITIVHRGGTL